MSDLTPARLEKLLATVSLPLDNRGRTSREKSEAIETLIALYATLSSRVIELEAENARLRETLGDMLDDCEPDRPGAPRLSIREAARAVLNGGDYEA